MAVRALAHFRLNDESGGMQQLEAHDERQQLPMQFHALPK